MPVLAGMTFRVLGEGEAVTLMDASLPGRERRRAATGGRPHMQNHAP